MTHSRSVNLFDLSIFLLVCISFASILLLALNRFNPYHGAAIGVVITGIFAIFFRSKIDRSVRRIPLALLLILIIGVFFRVPPYLYVPGGQDHGVYINMGATYEKKGSTFIVDHVRKKAIEAGLGKYYDSANQMKLRQVKPGAYEGTHLPGIYIKDSKKSEYVYQFYPLHPLWMAVAGKLMGEANLAYSLTFFSLLSIIGLYFLSLELPGGTRVSASLAAILIALNPLHAFFSKFPVSEVVALGFSSLGFFYLVRYYNKVSETAPRAFYLSLSAGLFGCMFFTRITGFMYMPVFYFLFVVTLLWEKRANVRKQLSLFFLTVFGLYALSVGYGLIYSYPYSHDIYRASFSQIFHSSWETGIFYTVVAAIFLLLIVWIFGKSLTGIFEKNRVLRIARENVNVIFCLALMGILGLSLYKSYQLSFTDQYSKIRWGFSGLGWSSINYSNIVVAIKYLSPMGFAVFLWGVLAVFPKKKDISWIALMLFLCMFWYLDTVMRFVTVYQYYYARYLLTELIPYTLVAVSLVLGSFLEKGKLAKVIAVLLAISISGYFLYFTNFQFLGRSADGAYAAIKEIDEVVQEDDLLFLNGIDPPLQWELRMPLSFFLDLNTCILIKKSDMESIEFKRFLMKYKNAFVLSGNRLNTPYFDFVDKINFRIGNFVNSGNIPRKYKYSNEALYLYKISKKDLTSRVIYPLERKDDLVNFHNGLWTNGNGIIRNVNYPLKPGDRFVRIETKGNIPGMHETGWPKPVLYIDGIKQTFCAKTRNSFVFRITKGIQLIRELRIVSDTFVPREKGINNDDRVMGMDVSAVVIDDKSLANVIYPMEIKEDLSHFHRDGVWTDGNGIIRNIHFELKPSDRFISIQTFGWNPFLHENKHKNKRSGPALYINGIKQTFYAKTKNSFVFQIVGGIHILREIRIVSDTFIPDEVGLSNDKRRLGVDVASIEITEKPPAPLP
jgi:hypothetical protein